MTTAAAARPATTAPAVRKVQIFLALAREVLNDFTRADRLERARRLNAQPREFDPVVLLNEHVETRQWTPAILEKIATAPTDAKQAVEQAAWVEGFAFGAEGENVMRKVALSDLPADVKAEWFSRALLPLTTALAVVNADRFEADVYLAMSAFWRESLKVGLRFDPRKANTASFGDFCKASMDLRTTALADDVCEGGRKVREQVKQLQAVMEDLDLDMNMDARDILYAMLQAEKDKPELERKPLPQPLNSAEKIQALIEIMGATTRRGSPYSLDFLENDEEGNERRYGDRVVVDHDPHGLQTQVEEEQEVAPLLDRLLAAGVTLDQLSALKDKVSIFLEEAAQRAQKLTTEPKWAEIILATIGADAYMTDMADELAAELDMDLGIARVLTQEVLPFYQGKMAQA
ncbi:hypothetical protein [Deinococcus ficus]|uniref:Uncharacterized protein n=1 Tax=Deinococcus ficus TaxID=317577 RepID=A0A221T320_9DEIO|nr:hypothetical protein [Deinococcus ficus]ASN83283.1 hypothetical protein DFI_18975 [Deinococcus ficus]